VTVRVLLLHHPSDQAFVASLLPELARGGFERVLAAPGADVALCLASRAALEDGLGGGPRQALEAGVPALTVLLGEDLLPAGFPVHRKHAPLAKDVAGVLRHLTEHRAQRGAHQIDGKRELFGYGVLLALLARGGRSGG
jgi:hypothetical protein